MRLFKTLIIFALFLSLATVAFAQTAAVTDRFRAAQTAFDNSQYEKTLILLDEIEKDLGSSPRIESLRALTLRDLNRPRDAYLSVLAYFKLTEGKDLSNSAAHKSLIELRDALKAQLETDLSVKKDNLQAERNENADKAISETGAIAKPTAQTSNVPNDPLAELEMWNKLKASTDANDYYLFLMRFPGGAFAKQASAKMNEIGDPVWNQVRSSKDAFVYRDFIAKNPNSPFIALAKDRMNMLAASMIAWEQIKDSRNLEDFEAYVNKYPSGANRIDAIKMLFKGAAINIVRYNPERKKHSIGKLEYSGDKIKYTEFRKDGFLPPQLENNVELSCSQLFDVQYRTYDSADYIHFVLPDGKRLIYSDRDATDRIKKFIFLSKSACQLSYRRFARLDIEIRYSKKSQLPIAEKVAQRLREMGAYVYNVFELTMDPKYPFVAFYNQDTEADAARVAEVLSDIVKLEPYRGQQYEGMSNRIGINIR